MKYVNISSTMQRYAWFILLPILFLAFSLPLFFRVYGTTKCVIDEEFHLRQGLHYCNKQLDVWDQKITTFPGLYIATMIAMLFDFCSVLGLRLVSLIAAAFNVVLLFKIRLKLFPFKSPVKISFPEAALDAFTISALPPLYFFAHVYYTDVLSLTSVLCFYDEWLQKKHLTAAVCAAISVLIRQTNVVWVVMLCGITALDVLMENYSKKLHSPYNKVSLMSFDTLTEVVKKGRLAEYAKVQRINRAILVRDPSIALSGIATNYGLLWISFLQILKCCCFYLFIIVSFVGFVFINGSVVLGDKAAHSVSIHLPQLFYFALFTLCFAVGNTLQHWKIALCQLHKERLIALFSFGMCILIVKWNTLEHPYLLADNRHYIFYIWNRFYGRYSWFRYAIVPLYIYAMTLIYCSLFHMRSNFIIMYAVAVLLSLCFQKLLELRYFIIPYVFFRLHTPPWPYGQRSKMLQWLELAQHIVINAFTFYIFFTKEVHWHDFAEPQHIIW